MTSLRVALIQTRTPATQRLALEHLRPLIEQAAAGGAQLILTPEASNFMEKRPDRKAEILAGQDEDAVVQGVRTLARDSGAWILLGSAMVRSGDPSDPRAANRSILINGRGDIESTYDKLHVFDVDLPNGDRYRESAGVRPGDRAVVAATPWGGLGLTRSSRSPPPSPGRRARRTGKRCCGHGPSRPAPSSLRPPRAATMRTAARPGAGR